MLDIKNKNKAEKNVFLSDDAWVMVLFAIIMLERSKVYDFLNAFPQPLQF